MPRMTKIHLPALADIPKTFESSDIIWIPPLFYSEHNIPKRAKMYLDVTENYYTLEDDVKVFLISIPKENRSFLW